MPAPLLSQGASSLIDAPPPRLTKSHAAAQWTGFRKICTLCNTSSWRKGKNSGRHRSAKPTSREKKTIKVEQHLIKELKALYAEIKAENEKEAIKVEKSESGSASEWECASESGRSSEWEAVA